MLLNQSYAGRQDQNAQAHRQQHFPSHLHELIKTVSGERATIPDIEVHKARNFRREPENVLHSRTHGRDKQYKANQAKDNSESRESDGLNAEQRMLRHTDCIEKTRYRKQKKCDAGKKREDQIPSRAVQKIRKWPQPSAQPERDRDGRYRDHGGVFRKKE